jgi:HD-GYP domain-containing protein (c-di-GMP phosphodiesterase class II)
VQVAHDAEYFHRLGGPETCREQIARRSGAGLDPAISSAFLQHAHELLAAVPEGPLWEVVIEAEPEPQVCIPAARLDDLAAAFADFTDLKSPFTSGHSSGVARLAEVAARARGASNEDVTQVRRAALLHDLGRTAVPNGIWDKPGPLSTMELERVRLHPYHTERILSRSRVLQPLAGLAGAHHERLDGSGYHRGSEAPHLPLPARVLAAADAYQAMTQDRPYRPALALAEAARELREEAASGRLDRAAV